MPLTVAAASTRAVRARGRVIGSERGVAARRLFEHGGELGAELRGGGRRASVPGRDRLRRRLRLGFGAVLLLSEFDLHARQVRVSPRVVSLPGLGAAILLAQKTNLGDGRARAIRGGGVSGRREEFAFEVGSVLDRLCLGGGGGALGGDGLLLRGGFLLASGDGICLGVRASLRLLAFRLGASLGRRHLSLGHGSSHLSLCLGSGLRFSLGFGLRFSFRFGIRFSLGFCLRFSLGYGLRFSFRFGIRFSLGYGLRFSLGYGLRFSLGYGLRFSLGYGLRFSLGYGLRLALASASALAMASASALAMASASALAMASASALALASASAFASASASACASASAFAFDSASSALALDASSSCLAMAAMVENPPLTGVGGGAASVAGGADVTS